LVTGTRKKNGFLSVCSFRSENRKKRLEREEVAQVLEVEKKLHRQRRRSPAGSLKKKRRGGVPRRLLGRRRLRVEEPRVWLEVPEEKKGVDGRVLERDELAKKNLLQDGQAAAALVGKKRVARGGVGVVLGHGRRKKNRRGRGLRAGLVPRGRGVLPGPGAAGVGREKKGSGVGPAELDGGGKKNARGLLGGFEGAEPKKNAAPRVADLRRELEKKPPPDAAELGARRGKKNALAEPPRTRAAAAKKTPPAVAVPGAALLQKKSRSRWRHHHWRQLKKNPADPPRAAPFLLAKKIRQVRVVPEDPHREKKRHGAQAGRQHSKLKKNPSRSHRSPHKKKTEQGPATLTPAGKKKKLQGAIREGWIPS
ncbi:hypothetical protein BAE44_0019717, partial [Dichanthelium oligosanthes]